MKTLKDMFEVYRPKSPDEQKFVDKHVVIKHKDRNEVNGKANGDDVFKATNIKTVDREKTRHGYDTGKDEKVYEENEFVNEEELDEVSIEAMKKYRAASRADADDADDDDDTPRFRKRIGGLFQSRKKILSKGGTEEDLNDKGFGKKLTKEDIINRVIDKYMPEVADIKALTMEQRLAKKLDGLSEGHTALLFSLFTNLNEDNQLKMIHKCEDRDGINELIDFALENKGE